MRLAQSIDHNITIIFLEKLYTKYGEETIPSPFSKKSKSLVQYLKFYTVSFYCMPS